MKTHFFSLLAASPILFALAPRADAAAITFDTAALQPRMLGPGSFYQRNRSGVPGSVFRTPAAKVSSAINDALNLSGGTIKTGAGTLSLDNSGFINGGILTVGGGTLSNGTVNLTGGTVSTGSWASVGSGTIDANGFELRISGGTILTRNTDSLASGLNGLSVRGGIGTLTFENSQTLDSLVIDSATAVTLDAISSPPLAPSAPGAATSPVPEPASAVLLVIGALAVSRSRRRRES